jgi:arsenate reductase
MSERPRHVLFICTGNSARSILAEAMLRHLGGSRFVAHSAGSHPTGVVNPLTLDALTHLKQPTTGLRSKSWDEFAKPGAPALDFVFTVCDQAAGEVCPHWPGQPISAHWGVPDPAAAEGTDAQRLQKFVDTALTLKRRIDLMLALPIDKLDAMALTHELRSIGQS